MPRGRESHDGRGMKVIVHAGFHKTGTTSLQQGLRANDKLLAPHAALYYGARLQPVLHRGRHFGFLPGPKRLAGFRRDLRVLLDKMPDAERIVLTREAFSGAMVGETRADGVRITSYGDTAVILARALAEGIAARFPGSEIVFLYTTRDTEGYIASAWKHLLRLRRMTEDYQAFAATVSPHLDLDQEVARLTAALAPHRVVVRSLSEIAASPEGPASAVFDLLDLPRDLRNRITPAPAARRSQSDTLSAWLLEANRTIADDAELHRAKVAALAEAGLGMD
ncbi:hypothetical protein [Roseisalinus antarcticus]|uniref:Sulfotransferase family protein n=1 Tax=Roseisalinus antarcticus TaxID=254357 RepID=A0A1Y5SBS3_9RHOB|nr:hypothetical protein [Roseisalinus antarcticus]SLN37153.1 hypothetical protein ROA7023_01379 [Roseisalinus antarcticus]